MQIKTTTSPELLISGIFRCFEVHLNYNCHWVLSILSSDSAKQKSIIRQKTSSRCFDLAWVMQNVIEVLIFVQSRIT